MTYLRVCDTDEPSDIQAKAFRSIARAFKAYAELTERWEFMEPHQVNYQRGQCRVYCEYDTLYLRIGDVSLATYLAGQAEFEGRWRKPDTVRIFPTA